MKFSIIDVNNSGKALCEIGWNWRTAPLEDYDLWCALAGKGTMRINGIAYPIQKGACFLVHPGDQPEADQDPENRLTVVFIHFTVEQEAAPYKDELLPERVIYLEEVYELEQLLNQVLETKFKKDEWTAQEFDCLMKQMLMKLYRSRKQAQGLPTSSVSKKQRQVVSQVMRRIQEDNGRSRPYEELAQLVGLTPGYLSKLFKQVTGISVKEYITHIRLQRAQYLLSQTSMNVSQVSETLGYSSIFLFSKQFKQHYGLPPSHFKFDGVQPRSHGEKKTL
ncbi:AraC family transcriptional regulator [Paenibacillus qinlingensis]|uniref:AraC-like DNA-binding protein n=1 Tax=Paenibacillus qinlingensis TaxID=1837343 RepID=A0ABU1NNY9_9BACL|nr:AraC family transcriptional regulator [Paenibacillus qinlingensis]MDR6549094.1 AraC-like DNA-binding protein [Paenibacillus qinlingensis]